MNASRPEHHRVAQQPHDRPPRVAPLHVGQAAVQLWLGIPVVGAGEFAPEGDGRVAGRCDDDVVVDAFGDHVQGEGVGGAGDVVEQAGQGGGEGGAVGGGAEVVVAVG